MKKFIAVVFSALMFSGLAAAESDRLPVIKNIKNPKCFYTSEEVKELKKDKNNIWL